MSIYIKGMEMPICCCNCPLAKLSPTGETLFCNYTLSTVPWDDKPFDCPLIPVPPHGRLIDADALFDFILNIYKLSQGDARKAYSDVLDTIVAAGDIIPADKEGEGCR